MSVGKTDDWDSLNPALTSVKSFQTDSARAYPTLFLWMDVALMGFLWAFLTGYFRPGLLLLPTITAGGDTTSHYYTAQYLKEVLLPQGLISGWCQGNLGGFPVLQYYFPLPFLLMALLSLLIPLAIAFKLVTVTGIFLLPLCTYLFFRLLAAPFPTPIAGAAFSMVFLFMEGNSMWGGNIPSTLAGEFCYSLGFALAIVWMGVVFRTMETRKGLVLCALLEALVGLGHAYALLFVGVASAWFLFSRKRFLPNLVLLVKIHALAFCFMGFWILPLLHNLPDTTRFNILWVFQNTEQILNEVVPTSIRPFLWLTLACGVLAISFKKTRKSPPGAPSIVRAMAYLVFLILCGGLLYFLGYRARVVDVRFLPFFQFFGIVSGACLAWLLIRLFAPGKGLRAVLAAVLVLGAVLWTNANETFIAYWAQGNYEGVEKKFLWPAYKSVNDYLKGSVSDPRVAYEHSMVHTQAGTVRAFESLPLFSGRNTLEGVYIQASLCVPFIFYLQSEISQSPSTPIPDYSYFRFDPDRAFAHLEMFNVSQWVVAEDATKKALSDHPLYHLEHTAGPYQVYGLKGVRNAYATHLNYKPALLPEKNFRSRAYTWFRAGNPDVVPVFSDTPGPERDARFITPKTFEPDMRNLPESPLPPLAAAPVHSRLENQRIVITGAVPGRPLLVKAAYHKGWKVDGADRVYLAGPGFMLVFPKQPDVTLTFGKTWSDTAGLALSLLAVLLALLPLVPPLSRPLGRASALLDRLLPWVCVPALVLVLAGAAVALFPLGPEYPALPFNKAIAHFKEKDYANARTWFAHTMEKHPQTLIIGEASFHHAMTYYLENDYESTIQSLYWLLSNYPEATRAPEASYHIGLCHMKLGQKNKARQAFQETLGRYPETIWAGFARDRMKEL